MNMISETITIWTRDTPHIVLWFKQGVFAQKVSLSLYITGNTLSFSLPFGPIFHTFSPDLLIWKLFSYISKV